MFWSNSVVDNPPSNLDSATIAWVAAVVANGGTVSTSRQIIVNNLIITLKANAVWTKYDRLWLFGAENEPSALTDLVSLQLATAVNTPVFTIDRGYLENGATSYIDTNYLPNGSGNYTLNAAHLSCWVTTAGGAALDSHCVSDVADSHIFPIFLDGNTYFRVNANAGGGVANATRAAFYHANRSAAAAVEGYNNGAQVITGATAASALPPTSFVFGSNGGHPGSDNVAGGTFGASFSVAEAANSYTALRTYMTAVGVP